MGETAEMEPTSVQRMDRAVGQGLAMVNAVLGTALGGTGGLYGGGGGAGGYDGSGDSAAGGNGGAAIIVMTYTP